MPLGPLELVLIGLLLVLIFGMGRLGLLKNSFAKAVASFKQAAREKDPE